MSEGTMIDDVPGPLGQPSLRLPATKHELWALLVALGAVFALVQIGAPIIRTFEFLDPKLRDYFIGISFAAFPLIHRSAKHNLARLSWQTEPVLHDSAPWYVAGVVAAAVLFGWNQFVSLLAGLAIGVMLSSFPETAMQAVKAEDLNLAVTTAALIIAMPLSAVAAVYAGILLNRHTRSYTFAAVGLAALCFIMINALMTWVMQPEMMLNVFGMLAQGGSVAMQVVMGMSIVGIVIFCFGSLGVTISRFNRERPLGRIVEAARKLPAEDREALSLQLTNRVNAAVRGVPSVAAIQLPTSAEP